MNNSSHTSLFPSTVGIRFNPIKGMKFSHKGTMFEITGVWLKGYEPTTVIFKEKHSGKIFEKPAQEIIDKLHDNILKYEGL